MNKNYSLSLIFILLCSFASFLSAETSLHINIVCQNNGVGLTRDFNILKEELVNLGHSVSIITVNLSTGQKPQNLQPVDINIFIEHSHESLLPFAKKNYFIPNPEWSTTDIRTIQNYDMILCRTKEVQRIFSAINPKTYYLGFTSIDRQKKTVPKDYNKFFHLRGKKYV